MKKITPLSVLVALSLHGIAQENTIKPLTIGDELPNLFLYPTSSGRDTMSNRTLTAPLTILDIWAVNCVPCIKAFPKMDTLEKAFGGKLRVLLITGSAYPQKISAADSTLSHFEKVFNISLRSRSFYMDISTTRLFYTMVTVPHYIWLDKTQRIIATTGADQITEANIRSLLTGEAIPLKIKPAHVNNELSKDSVVRIVTLSL